MALADVRSRVVEEVEHDSGLGVLLRQARERLGASLDRIASETKIPKRHLEALEHDNLSVAPGGIYLRAEVRAFARAVHLDESLALTRLERLLNPPSAPTETRAVPRSSEADRQTVVLTPIRPWVPLAVLTLAALVATLSWWPAGQRDDVGPRGSAALSGEPPAVTREASPAEPLPPVAPPPARPASAPASPVDAPRPAAMPRATRPVEPPRATDDEETPEPNGAITELMIATQPPGARVTVNGISWGTSPVAIRHLPPGPKRIRVSLDGYASAERSINLAAGRRQRIEVPLRGR